MGTRYTEVIDLTSGNALAPGEVRVVNNPVLRDPAVILVKRLEGDLNLVIDQIQTTAPFTLRVTNPGTLPNESVLGVVYRHSVPK
jgi:hypothetical protein